MFDFIKETIVNDSAIILGPTTAGAGKFIVKHAGEYAAANVVSSKVFKQVPAAGSVASATIACASLTAGLYMCSLSIKMSNKYLGEYANANWQVFGKPVMVQFEAATDGGVAAALKAALEAAVPESNKFMTVSISSTTVTVTLTDKYASIASITLSKYDPTAVANSELGDYVDIDTTSIVSITVNVEPFATGEWLVENLRFPSYPNRRYNALYADETPVAGAQYTQFSFQYKVANRGLGGLSAVGQLTESVTTHVFYVKSDAVSAFNSALTSAGLTVVAEGNHAASDETHSVA